MSNIAKVVLLFIMLFISACEEKKKPNITIKSELKLPIKCMKLERLDTPREFIETLQALYEFSPSCALKLSISYKKDIICNSTNNINMKSTGRFPKSYLKIELREGMALRYSYYIDLYSNVDSGDIEEGFRRMEQDLLGVEVLK